MSNGHRRRVTSLLAGATLLMLVGKLVWLVIGKKTRNSQIFNIFCPLKKVKTQN